MNIVREDKQYMLRRVGKAFVAVCFLFAFLMTASCSGEPKSPMPEQAAPGKVQHGPLWIEGGEGVTLTYWIPIDYIAAEHFDNLAEHPFFVWMEEQTGVKVEFVHPSDEQMEMQFNLMVASDEYYDMLFCPAYTDGAQAAIDDGVFADLNEYRSIMPNYFKAISCDDASFASWEWGIEKRLYWQGAQPAFENALTTVNGNLWCCSQVWTDSLPTECGMLIRQDWLDEAHLDMPQTLDDLEKVLEAFQKRRDDVIPMTLGIYGYNAPTGAILSAYGIRGDWFTVTDGIVDPVGCTTPAFKEYLARMHDWYEKGYIDPDFPNRDYESQESLLLSDRLGIFAQTLGDPTYYEGMYTGASPDFDLSAMPLPRMTEDQILTYCFGYDSSACNYTVIAENSEHKEIAAKWLDALFSKEAILRASYGVEGESYTMDADGVPYYTDWFYHNSKWDVSTLKSIYLAPNMTGYWSARANALHSAIDTTVDGQQNVLSPWYEAAQVWGQNANTSSTIGYVNMDGATYEAVNVPYGEANAYAQPMILKFIMGKEPLSDFDAYAQKALSAGYRDAREHMQRAYNLQHGQAADYGLH